MKRLFTWLPILAVLGGGLYFAGQRWPEKIPFWKTEEKPDPKKPARPSTAVVTPRDISFAVTAAGEITPAEQVSVRPEISGLIDKLPVDIGDHIQKGMVLFTLDDRDLQAEKSQVLIEIEGARLQVNSSRLALEKSELTYQRTHELAGSKLVSQETYDNVRLERDTAKNAVDIAQNNLSRSEKALETVEVKLSKTKIVAPFDCTVLTRPVSVGQAVSGASGVNSGTEVLTIADLGELIINAHINQADVTRMKISQPVQIEVEAVAGLKLTGRLDRIAPQATIKNGIKGFATRIIVKNDENTGVRPGMTANLTIPLEGADNVLAVPLAAVFTDQGERFAYVKAGEKYQRTPIRIGVTDYDFAEVRSGLAEGQIVSLVTPPGDEGKAQQAFGAAAAKGGKAGAGKGGEGKSAASKGGGSSGGSSGSSGRRSSSGT